jgi:hypothetical protein
VKCFRAGLRRAQQCRSRQQEHSHARVEQGGSSIQREMATSGSALWVNDVTRIRSFNLKTGAPGLVVAPAGAVFVNDLAVGRRGNLWASDSETHSLYRVSTAGRVTPLRLPERFPGRPNGVALHPRPGEI